MKVNVEIELTVEEFKELLVPSEKQTDFMYTMYDAWVKAFKEMNNSLINPDARKV